MFTGDRRKMGDARGAGVDAGAGVAGRGDHRRAQRVDAVADALRLVNFSSAREPMMYRTSSSPSRTRTPIAPCSQHIEQLARLTGAALLLVHVADGWAARHFDDLELRESEEMREDRAYLERLCDD